MSALPPKADIRCRDLHVRFVPKADIGTGPLIPGPTTPMGGSGRLRSRNELELSRRLRKEARRNDHFRLRRNRRSVALARVGRGGVDSARQVVMAGRAGAPAGAEAIQEVGFTKKIETVPFKDR